MLCQICKKNPASVHMQEIRNGKTTVLHLCMECAGKRGVTQNGLMEGFDLTDLLKAFELSISNAPEEKKTPPAEEEDLQDPCPICMWRAEDVRKTGLFGCPECYIHFKELAVERLLELNNATVHTGKVPDYSGDLFNRNTERPAAAGESRKSIAARINALKQDMEESVRREEFELAAQLRDELNALLKENQVR